MIFKKITGHHSIDKRFLIGEVMYNVVTFDYLNKYCIWGSLGKDVLVASN